MANFASANTEVIHDSRVGLLIPTLNGGPVWKNFIDALALQNLQPTEVLVLDSGSTDNTVNLALSSNFTVLRIAPSRFDHGGTRNEGMMHFLGRIDFLVCMTQDAVFTDSESLKKLLISFEDLTVGAAFGRQLPSPNANPIAAHARLFNYPATPRTTRLADQRSLGFKACFMSNSFAAYRMSELTSVGGFPQRVILGEDTTVAARIILSGKAVTYQAEACVYHSHNYTPIEEFRRYFDTGVFHARSPWLLTAFGGAEGEGKRFAASETRYLFKAAPWLIPSALLRNLLKLLGYRLGRAERWLPLEVKRHFGMFHAFWSGDPKHDLNA